ncbi:MAG: replication initiator protein A, partial [Blastocatellia bacterium]
MSRRKAASIELGHENTGRLLKGAARFVAVEKNLASLGFFSASSTRVNGDRKKEVMFTKLVNGRRAISKVTIVPAALYGLPITADQDKYLALQRIVTDIKSRRGTISNPVGFSTSELLKLLGQKDAGKNYREISDWLDLMSNTGIISEGAVYIAGKKSWERDRFHVFDRAVSPGREIEPGQVADKNYVWFSEWQLQNLNNSHLLPIDYEAYRLLKNPVAKALVLHLQVWMYASSQRGVFEKSYDDLCQLLSLRRYRCLSEIERKWKPSLDELKSYGFIREWEIKPAADGKDFKVAFYDGERSNEGPESNLGGEPVGIHSRERAEGDCEQPLLAFGDATTRTDVDQDLLKALTDGGIVETEAIKVLKATKPEQPILLQLAWADHEIAKNPKAIESPGGFRRSFIERDVTPPQWFIERWHREKAAPAQSEASQIEARLDIEYEAYKAKAIDDYVSANAEEYERLKEELWPLLKKEYPKIRDFSAKQVEGPLNTKTRQVIVERGLVSLMDFDQFCKTNASEAPL